MQLKTTVCQPISKSQSSIRTSRQSVLLYGSEIWRTTTSIINKVELFINNCLLKILNIHLSYKSSPPSHTQHPFAGYHEKQPTV
ncbi:unnamed protein product [Schistosoma margrebowiei]|uniref:Uncharacterized protein n=1 Tax=Schistosoma margrebowiei TaxID=48269 RepID=A0A183M6D4_9TREM|nr:unnamed protein product [Schistosoma margrebowiei]